MESVVFLFFFLFVTAAVLIGVFAIPLLAKQLRKSGEAWSTAARRLGLRYDPGGFLRSRRIDGPKLGFDVLVDTFSRSSGNSSTTYTRFRVTYPRSLRLGLRLTREGFFSSVSKVFGAQDIEVGDAAFDAGILVKGTSPRRMREFLTPARRVRIHRLLKSCPAAVVNDEEVCWQQVGVLRDPGAIVSIVRRLLRVAWHLTGDREDDQALDRALEAQDGGRVEDALTLLRRRRRGPVGWPLTPDAPHLEELPPDPPPLPPEVDEASRVPPPLPVSVVSAGGAAVEETDEARDASPGETAREADIGGESAEEFLEAEPIEERVLEGELLYLSGRQGEAKKAFEQALAAAPDDPEIRDWVDRAAAESGRAEKTDAPPPAEVPLDVESVCGALFDPKHSSLDSNRVFEERYEGRDVEWTGKLVKVEAYPFDFVFGNEPGTKAVIEIHEVDSALYGDRKISAVVQLDEAALKGLEEGTGRSICFAGRLLRVDGFMRNIYVASGRLEN